MVEVKKMSKEFQEFMQKEVIPLIQNYKAKNNREKWYQQFYLVPNEPVEPYTYIKMLLKLREDSKVTFQFKVFMLQLASIVNTRFLESKETKSS